MRQRHWAPCVRLPSCLRREVSRNDLFIQVRRHRAWTRFDVHGPADYGSGEAGGKARCRSVFETRAARIDQHDAAVAPAGGVFHELAQRFKDCRQRTATRDRFQSRFSAARRASARLRSPMSVFCPYHFTRLPVSSRSGTALIRNHRNVPSNRRNLPRTDRLGRISAIANRPGVARHRRGGLQSASPSRMRPRGWPRYSRTTVGSRIQTPVRSSTPHEAGNRVDDAGKVVLHPVLP